MLSVNGAYYYYLAELSPSENILLEQEGAMICVRLSRKFLWKRKWDLESNSL